MTLSVGDRVYVKLRRTVARITDTMPVRGSPEILGYRLDRCGKTVFQEDDLEKIIVVARNDTQADHLPIL